jgi:predicted GNAT family acetyltransferase
MTNTHPLDRPVWNSLNMGWSSLALGDVRALRLEPDYGPFGAAADFSAASLEALAGLVPTGGQVWTAEAGESPVPPGLAVMRTARLHQMVLENLHPLDTGTDIVPLAESDAEEMRTLAHLTEPGPFFARTNRLGDFVGVKQDGRLVAMAGERMKLDGFTEVSGVCTHPDHRGHGYAGALMSVVSQKIIARGETPFLHSYSTNTGAIALYERLGFVLRRQITVTILSR